MAVVAYTGLLGSGKTYAMVREARATMKSKRCRVVYTNMASLCFPNSHFINSIEELYPLENGLIVLDEAHIWVPSRFWNSMPREFAYKLSMMRHFGLELMFTTQAMERVDKILREITSYVVRCRFLKPLQLFLTVKSEPYTKEIVQRQAFRLDPSVYNLYDTMEVVGVPSEQESGSNNFSFLSARSAQSRPRAKVTPVRQRKLFRLNAEEKPVHAWLTKKGLIHSWGIHPRLWLRMVELEVVRWRWLAGFGLTADDVPFDCTPERPWLTPPPVRPGSEVMGEAVPADVPATVPARRVLLARG